MPGATIGIPSPAPAGPTGILPEEGGDRGGVFPEPGQAGGEVCGQDPQLQGAPTVQVSCSGGPALRINHFCHISASFGKDLRLVALGLYS